MPGRRLAESMEPRSHWRREANTPSTAEALLLHELPMLMFRHLRQAFGESSFEVASFCSGGTRTRDDAIVFLVFLLLLLLFSE